jgi:VWFA-related protein
MARRSRGHAARIVLLASLTLSSATAQPSTPPPVRIDLEEQAQASLSVVRVRIEPTRSTSPGACQVLGLDDLVVEVQGRELSGSKYLRLDRVRTPTLHALVLDSSASMTGSFEYAKLAARQYVEQLDPQRERALVLTFDENVVMRHAPTADRERLTATVDALRTGSRTALLDAVYDAALELDTHRERPVLVLLTDGADTSSFHSEADIEAQVARRPDMAVFAIGVGLRTDAGQKPTRELLRRLASQTGGAFFEVGEGQAATEVFSRIRDILDDEAILTVASQKRVSEPQRIKVRSKNRDCSVRVLHAIGAGELAPVEQRRGAAPRTLEAQLDPLHFASLERRADRSVDPACRKRLDHGGGAFGPEWYVDPGSDADRGCVPDITRDYGRLFGPLGVIEQSDRLQLTARPFEIPVVPLESLPHSPEEALEQLGQHVLALRDAGALPAPDAVAASSTSFVAYPWLVHGSTWLEMRRVLARAAFLHPDYRDWALARVASGAAEELKHLTARYRSAFPDLSASTVEAAARLSVEGRAIAARAEQPSVVDLAPVLAAWHGDIPAHELFLAWERRRIDRALAGVPPSPQDERFVEAWVELRRIFSAPAQARVLALLVPTHADGCDCIGYWRVELPRPGWMLARSSGQTADRDVTGDYLDLVPEAPAAWLALERLSDEAPGLLEALRDGGFRAADLSYELNGLPALRTPEGAFGEYRVALTLASGAGDEEQLLVLRPEMRRASDGDPGRPTFLDLTIESSDRALPPPLVEGLRAGSMRILGIEEMAQVEPAEPPAEASPSVVQALGAVLPAAEDPWSGFQLTPGAASPSPSRATAYAVVVPVIVRRGDEVLRGLTRENFELLDQGQRRRLETVTFVDLREGAQAPATGMPRAARRQLLFLFDLAFTSPAAAARARNAVLETADRLHPSDLAAVAAYSADRGARLVLDFTDDREALRKAVAKLAAVSTDDDLRAIADRMNERARMGDSSSGGGSERDEMAREHAEAVASDMESTARRGRAARVETLFRDLGSLARWLRRVPGRKNVVFLSEGFDSSLVFAEADGNEQRAQSEAAEHGQMWDVESQRRFGDTALRSSLDVALEELRRADSPIEAVHLTPAGAEQGRAGEESLHALARGTNGALYPAGRDLGASLARVLERTGEFYVLVFQPDGLVPDGGYHKLRLKLKNVPGGTQVDYRPGYFAPESK